MNDNAVKSALAARLEGDATLTAIIGATSVFDTLAPQNEDPPYVIFQKQSGVPSYTLSERIWDDQLYAVKAVADGASAAQAGTIHARIDALLTDQPLTVSGHTNHLLRRRRDIDYTETLPGGNRVRHMGAVYEVVIA